MAVVIKGHIAITKVLSVPESLLKFLTKFLIHGMPLVYLALFII